LLAAQGVLKCDKGVRQLQWHRFVQRLKLGVEKDMTTVWKHELLGFDEIVDQHLSIEGLASVP
jgi:hypothetical protein